MENKKEELEENVLEEKNENLNNEEKTKAIKALEVIENFFLNILDKMKLKKIADIYRNHLEGMRYLVFGALATVINLGVKFLLLFTILDASNEFQLQAAVIISWIVFNIASGFLWNRYSICTGLTEANTCNLGCFASFNAFHVASTLSVDNATGTATMLFFTVEATDLIRSASIFGCIIPSNSMTVTPNLSNSFGISNFSLKDRVNSFPVCFMVMSLILIWSMLFLLFL